jgi:hypothetical protein
MGKKCYSLGNALGSGFGSVHPIASVMLGCTAKVPAIHAMCRPSASFVGHFVDQDFGAGWSERCFVVVEGTIELGFGREARVDAGGAHEIEGLGALVDEAAP